MCRSLRFANSLAGRLRHPAVEAVKGCFFRIEGRLYTNLRFVNIEIRVPWRFRSAKLFPPFVWCHEPWMRSGVAWHNLGDEYGLCWVHVEEWREFIAWRGKPVSNIVTEGTNWLFNNVGNLINRHYCAEIEGLTEWQPEWDDWKHDPAGEAEYRRARDKRRAGLLRRRRNS